MSDWRSLLEDGYMSSLWLLDREPGPLDFHGALIGPAFEGIFRRWCPEGGWIWDPMAGSGTAGRVAKEWRRQCFMSDLSPVSPDIHQADARTALVGAGYVGLDDDSGGRTVPTLDWDTSGRFQFDLIVLHPPYHNIIKFSDHPGDLSNCDSVFDFLAQWRTLVINVAKYLKDGGYLVMVCGDIWVTKEESKRTGVMYGHYPLAYHCFREMHTAMEMLDMNPTIKAIVTKNIKGNQARAKDRHLWASRYEKWGAVFFETEQIMAIQKG